MLRALIACLLVLLLTAGASPVWAATVEEQASQLKTGRKVVVKLTNGDLVKGKMGTVAADQFSVTSGSGPQMATRVVRFTEAQSVKADGLTTGQKWMIAGVVWLGLALVGSRL